MKAFCYHSLILEGGQLEIWKTGCLPAKEVVFKIMDDDFPKCDLELYDKDSKVRFDYEYDKMPMDGMFLLQVTGMADDLKLRVFIDTRTKPNYLWIEKLSRTDMEAVNKQITNAVKYALSKRANAYGWEVKVRKFVPGAPKDEDLYGIALGYAGDDYNEIKVDKEIFRSVVISYAVADEVIKWVLFFMKGKKKPLSIIAPLKAANVAGAMNKLTKTTFQEIFGNLLGNSVSCVDRYMSDGYVWNPNDKVFDRMVGVFEQIVAKILPLK